MFTNFQLSKTNRIKNSLRDIDTPPFRQKLIWLAPSTFCRTARRHLIRAAGDTSQFELICAGDIMDLFWGRKWTEQKMFSRIIVKWRSQVIALTLIFKKYGMVARKMLKLNLLWIWVIFSFNLLVSVVGVALDIVRG